MNIDSFADIPLMIVAGLGLLLFVFLIISKLRNSAKPSFIFYLIDGVIVATSVYNAVKPSIFYMASSLAVAMALILIYAIVIALSDPQKKEEKKAAKKIADSRLVNDNNSVSKEEFEAEKEKHKRIMDVNKDLIARVSSFFSANKNIESFLDYVNQLYTEKTKADGCAILMADEFDNVLAVKSFKGTVPPPYKLPEDLPHKPIRVETSFKFAQFPLTENIFGDVATSGKATLIEDSVKDPRIYQNGPEEFLRCGSYIFVPIIQQEGVAGVVALSRKPDNAKFTKEELVTAEILTDAVSTAMKPFYSFLNYAEHTELTKDGDIATRFQKSLIPSKLPVISNLSIGCFTMPAENVCGDYYDVIASRKDRISFIIGDVAGKGMNSLIIMVMIRAILRLIVNTPQSAGTILSWANRGICNDSSKIDHFASVALINYDSISKKAQIASCGNNPILCYKSATKQIEVISTPNEPMGVEKDITYADINLNLDTGDILVACTDGLVEALDEFGAQYTIEKLKKIVTAHAAESAKNISNRVKDDLKNFCGSAQQYDDSSLLVIKVQ